MLIFDKNSDNAAYFELYLQLMMYENSTQARANKVTTFTSLDTEDQEGHELFNALISEPGLGTWCTDSTRIEILRNQTVNRAAEKGFDTADRYCNPENLIHSWFTLDTYSNYTSHNVGDTNLTECSCVEGRVVKN